MMEIAYDGATMLRRWGHANQRYPRCRLVNALPEALNNCARGLGPTRAIAMEPTETCIVVGGETPCSTVTIETVLITISIGAP